MVYNRQARQREINRETSLLRPEEAVTPNTIKSIVIVHLKENHRATRRTGWGF